MAEYGYFSSQDETLRADPFEKSKRKGNLEALHVMKSVGDTLWSVIERANTASGKEKDVVVAEGLHLFLLRSLWGNKADLSLFSVTEDPLVLIKRQEEKKKHMHGKREDEVTLDYLLADDSARVCGTLLDQASKQGTKKLRVDLIVDNAGLELFR